MKYLKPWLDENGKPLKTEHLKLVSKYWDENTWEEYLKTLEYGIEGRQINPQKFNTKCDYLTENIWEFSSETAHPNLQETIQQALSKLTSKQRLIIEKYFFDNKSETQIAHELNLYRGSVSGLKERALKRIKEHLSKNMGNLPKVKGQESSCKDVLDQIEDHYWEGNLSDEEFYRLWALAENGRLKKEDLR